MSSSQVKLQIGSPLLDIDRDQCLDFPDLQTLIAFNVPVLENLRHWTRPMSQITEFVDIDRVQCLSSFDLRTLVGFNVCVRKNFGHWTRPMS